MYVSMCVHKHVFVGECAHVSMYVYMSTYMRAYMCVHVHAYMSVYMGMHTYVSICGCVYVCGVCTCMQYVCICLCMWVCTCGGWVCTCIHVCAHVCVHMHVYVGEYMCVHVCVHVYMWVCAYMQKPEENTESLYCSPPYFWIRVSPRICLSPPPSTGGRDMNSQPHLNSFHTSMSTITFCEISNREI